MNSNKYDKIIKQIEDAINNKDLGELIEGELNNCYNILTGDFDEDIKHKYAIYAEEKLGFVRDFPDKDVNSVSVKRR